MTNWWHILIWYWDIFIAIVSDWKHTASALSQWIIVEPHCQFIICSLFTVFSIFWMCVCVFHWHTFWTLWVLFNARKPHAISFYPCFVAVVQWVSWGWNVKCLVLCVCVYARCNFVHDEKKNWTRPMGMSSLRSYTPTHSNTRAFIWTLHHIPHIDELHRWCENRLEISRNQTERILNV